MPTIILLLAVGYLSIIYLVLVLAERAIKGTPTTVQTSRRTSGAP